MNRTAFRDRVRGLAWLPPGRIQEAPLNFRTHDGRQLEVIRGLLGEIGIAGGLLAWVPDESARSALVSLPSQDAAAFGAWLAGYSGPVRLIDGHARHGEIRQSTPVLVTDLSEPEAAKALATFDAVSDLAGADAATLAELLSDVRGREPGTLDLLGELQAFADTVAAKAERPPPVEPGASKVSTVDVSPLSVSFFLSARGPVGQQPEAIERLRAALASLHGVVVEVGLIGGAAPRG